MAVAMDRKEMVRLARLGAMARLQALEQERTQILASFPELKNASVGKAAGAAGAARAPRRRGMSAAARKAVSARMKKYWAERRKAKTAKA
jgi:hypothetical protein